MFFKKRTEKKSYDKENLKPVLKSSICTGETVAGFQNIHTGAFEEVMLIRDDKDLELFKSQYDIETLEKIY